MININPSGDTPIYRQIIEQIKEKVLLGLLAPGDKLPSVRELATQITTNPNTIQKAYQELERQKITITIRGRGTFVAEDYVGKRDAEQIESVQERFRKAIIDAHYLGMTRQEIERLINQLMEELKVRRN